ncbi:MAG: YdaS family helix-turn-helix protein, partial [Burkholderiales bacterium]
MRTGALPASDCPVAAPSRRTLHARTIHRACVVVGGAAQLAAQLDVSESAVRAWLEGVAQPPERAFLAAVEILL